MKILGQLKEKDTFIIDAYRKEMALKPEQQIMPSDSEMTLKGENALVKSNDTAKQIKLYSMPLD